MGRSASGVRGVRLHGPEDKVVGMVVVRDRTEDLLVVTERGYGKRSALEDYRVTRRGGKGVLTVRTSQRNGPMVTIMAVNNQDELMVMSSTGKVIRLKVKGVSVLRRATQGVKLIALEGDEAVVDITRLAREVPGTSPGGGNGGDSGDTGDASLADTGAEADAEIGEEEGTARDTVEGSENASGAGENGPDAAGRPGNREETEEGPRV